MQKLQHRLVKFCVALVVLGIVIVGLWRNGAVTGTPHNAYAAPVVATAVATSTSSVNAGITPGALSFTNGPPTGATPITLTNSDQSETYTIANTVSDNTGSGNGWNLTVSANQLTNGTHTLSTTATIVTGATISACQGGTCLLPINGTTYNVTITSGIGAAQGTGIKIFSAGANTGMGGVIITPTFSTLLPASAYAGAYSNTMIISLTSGP